MEGKIVKVSGPLIVAEGMGDAEMFDVVRVSEHKLIGEIIELRGDKASIQVYEETSGIGPGGPVYSTGSPLGQYVNRYVVAAMVSRWALFEASWQKYYYKNNERAKKFFDQAYVATISRDLCGWFDFSMGECGQYEK